MSRAIVILTVFVTLSSCIPEFDNEIVIRDLRKKYPEIEILNISSQSCDGTFGDCYYVNVNFKPNKFADPIDTSFQYNRLGNPDNPLVTNQAYNYHKESLNSSEPGNSELKSKLLQMHTWGLHRLTRLDSVEIEMILGDSDSRITFKNDSILEEYDTGIKRKYRWALNQDSKIEITEIKKAETEGYQSFLRLPHIQTIEKLDSANLILTTTLNEGVRYRYHYMKF